MKIYISIILADRSKGPVRELLKIYQGELGNCINFEENKSGVHANIEEGAGCSSSIGYNGNDPMKVTLPGKCLNKRNIKHEFTHLLGFMHEQARPDRDDYVTIIFDNVKSDSTSSISKTLEKCFLFIL